MAEAVTEDLLSAQDIFASEFTAESNGVCFYWPATLSRTTVGQSGDFAKMPPRRPGFAARAALAASLTGITLAGITAPGFTANDPFGQTTSSSIRDRQLDAEDTDTELSWADVVSLSTEEFLEIEAKRATLAEREAALYDSYELDDED